jgi:chromosome segregation ATPase
MVESSSQTDLDEIIVQYETRIKLLTEENENYLRGVQDHLKLKDQYEALTVECDEMKKSLLLSQDNCHLLSMKLNASNYEIEMQNNELTSTRNELTELKSGWNLLNQEMNHLQATHRELHNKIAVDAESIQNMKGSKNKLQKMIKNLELENQLLHINYAALQSIECRTCHKTISELYNESLQSQKDGNLREPKDEKNVGEDAFDNLPDELSQTDEIRQTESRLLEDSMKDLANNSRMMMNSSVLFKSTDKRQEEEYTPPQSFEPKPKSKLLNSVQRPSSRGGWAKAPRLKSPKLEAVVLPSTCAECLKRIKNTPKVLPTTLQNLDLNSRESLSPHSSEFVELGECCVCLLLSIMIFLYFVRFSSKKSIFR